MAARKENPTWEEIRAQLHSEFPELEEAWHESEPAFLLAREIMRHRERLGISQTELARRMGTTQSVVSRLERMETKPTLETAIKAARALGTSLELRLVEVEPGPIAFDEDLIFKSSEEFVEGVTRVLVSRIPLRQMAIKVLQQDEQTREILRQYIDQYVKDRAQQPAQEPGPAAASSS